MAGAMVRTAWTLGLESDDPSPMVSPRGTNGSGAIPAPGAPNVANIFATNYAFLQPTNQQRLDLGKKKLTLFFSPLSLFFF